MNRTSFSSPTEMFTCCVKLSLRRLLSCSPFCPCHGCYITQRRLIKPPASLSRRLVSSLHRDSCLKIVAPFVRFYCTLTRLHLKRRGQIIKGAKVVNGRDAHMWPLAPSDGANPPPMLLLFPLDVWAVCTVRWAENCFLQLVVCCESPMNDICLTNIFFSAPLQHVFKICSNSLSHFFKRKDEAFNVENLFPPYNLTCHHSWSVSVRITACFCDFNLPYST